MNLWNSLFDEIQILCLGLFIKHCLSTKNQKKAKCKGTSLAFDGQYTFFPQTIYAQPLGCLLIEEETRNEDRQGW